MSTDSGGAGQFRGGLGYDKDYRSLTDCYTLVSADRVRLGCYGVNGGHASKPFGVFVDAHGRNEKLGGLKDDVPLSTGEVLKVRTTGGGGWGNPLAREIESVRMDVWQEKVSEQAAKDIYGVVIEKYVFGEPFIDMAATEKRRVELRNGEVGVKSIIDRGPGLEELKLADKNAEMPERFA